MGLHPEASEMPLHPRSQLVRFPFWNVLRVERNDGGLEWRVIKHFTSEEI